MKRAVALLCLIALVVTGCGAIGGGGDPVQAIKSEGKLTCGVKFDVVGFGFRNPETNEIEGFDADLCRAIAQEMGVQADLQEAVSANRIPFLQEDKVDLIISTFTANDERRQQVDFSHIYYVAGQSILVKEDSDIAGVDDLNGVNVCSVEGSTSEANVREQAPDAELVLFKTYTEAGQALVDGRCDAVSTDNTILFGLARQFEGTKVLPETFTEEPLAIGIKKGSTALVTQVNQTLEKMKADGRLTQLHDKHIKPFTDTDYEAPF
jgi:putative glutamine transport system substrate-binding protein